jgi:hypothetical protein
MLLRLKGHMPLIGSRFLRGQGSICRQLLQKGDRRLQGRMQPQEALTVL